MLEERLNNIFKIFEGLPNDKKIVRKNTKKDAFPILVLELLFKHFHNKPTFTKDHLIFISERVVAPPDNGIDIFYEQIDGDEHYYHIVQVKEQSLANKDITDCFSIMKRTIKSYIKNRKTVSDNLVNVISQTEFDESYLKNIKYYVVHKGELNYIKDQEENETIITWSGLEILQNSLANESVPLEEFSADQFNNFTLYENSSEQPRAIICNLSGYELAKFTLKYISTELGRNILFGNNLREALDNSKTKEAMHKTINDQPERFWYYNNGITIIAEKLDFPGTNKQSPSKDKEVEKIQLTNFSIINGAQTASALGAYYKEADIDGNKKNMERLKNVFVLTRVVETKKDTVLRDSIAIYNNTQNPISNRDMASFRSEQKKLNQWLEGNAKPNIWVEIKRGTKPIPSINFEYHQKTTNELLAQLAFSGFLTKPFVAKDKKNLLFKDINSLAFNENEDNYFTIFNDTQKEEEKGILFKKNKVEIDELLFVFYLHNEAKKNLKQFYLEELRNVEERLRSGEIKDDIAGKEINDWKRLIEINNICHFYNLSYYYTSKQQFENRKELKELKNNSFDYSNFYEKESVYRKTLIDSFKKLFLQKTIKIIKEKTGESNINNWIRSSSGEEIFMKTVRDNLKDFEYSEQYIEFVKGFKTFKYDS